MEQVYSNQSCHSLSYSLLLVPQAYSCSFPYLYLFLFTHHSYYLICIYQKTPPHLPIHKVLFSHHLHLNHLHSNLVLLHFILLPPPLRPLLQILLRLRLLLYLVFCLQVDSTLAFHNTGSNTSSIGDFICNQKQTQPSLK